jgi:NTP pyrophosphatase (non-canonical NTP hydrolase)
MKLDDLQVRVDNWIKDFGVRYFDEKTNALLLVEEVGELARLIARKYGEQSFKNKTDEENVEILIGDEMADIIFVLSCLANQMNVNLTEVVEQNFKKKTSRDNLRHKSNKKLKH